MKVILLAAGEGTRLRPYTNDCPKCMVPFQNKRIIDWVFPLFLEINFDKVIVATGYQSEKLEQYIQKTYGQENILVYLNKKYASTNMVETLFCTKCEFTDDIIVSYGDIIYKKEVLEKLSAASGQVSVIVDQAWEKLWRMRMEDPLKDAETLKLNEDNCIMEIGKKPKRYEEIQGQYIGLIKIQKEILEQVKEIYKSLDREKQYDGQPFSKMYMTTFLQLLIDSGIEVKAIFIQGGWLEIDTVQDLENLKDFHFE